MQILAGVAALLASLHSIDVARAPDVAGRPNHVSAVWQQPAPQAPSDSARQPGSDSLRRRPTLAPVTVSAPRRRAASYAPAFSSTSTKTDLPLRDTPQSVTIVSSRLIRDQAMQNMTDALRYVPGVTMAQGEGHRDAPTIRGNASTADLFVDGVRDDAQYLRDLYNVERIELLAGSNAMTFGRGGGGGVVNRVMKRAQWSATRDLLLEGGSWGHARGTIDVGGPVAPRMAARVTGMAEHSGSFRDGVQLSRQGVNPTAAFALGERTSARIGAEYFDDARTVDRGMPSFRGRPSGAPLPTFFGNRDSSRASLTLRAADAAIQHEAGSTVTLRAQARATSYDKFYQNVFPGVVDSTGANVALSAYNNRHDRVNVFSQSELVWKPVTRLPQTLLAGAELSRQATVNRRNTGYFGGTSTTAQVPFAAPTVGLPVEFRPSATDADNDVRARASSAYAQHQLEATRWLQTVAGVRVERFSMLFHNHRTAETLERSDDLVSPRLGVVVKPAEPVSLYTSWSMSYLPSAGDQFSSLTATTKTLEPERFVNREVGAKWEITPELMVTGALYRLMRTNTSAPDPANPALVVQTGSQRSQGVELTAAGSLARWWEVAGAYTSQAARIVSRTVASRAGASVPLVPRERLSLWNRVQLGPALALGGGVVHQSDAFAAIDNSVTLPGFWRADAALYLTALRGATAQVNVENVGNVAYFPTSQGNNNIMPGAPRTVRVSFMTRLP